jgi:tetratricopeptide (TPR) repeat protein
VARSDQRIFNLRSQQQAVLLPFGNVSKEKTSLEKQLAEAVANVELLGEQFIWLCDPLDRMPHGPEDSTEEALKTAVVAQDGRFPSPFLHVALGFERLRSRQYAEADADFSTAAGMATRFYPRLVSMCAAAQALSLDRRGQVGKSREMFTATARLTADPGLVRVFYAHACVARGDHQRAMLELKTALKTSPDQPYVHEAMARLLATHPKAAMRNNAQAVEHARKACELAKWQSWTFADTMALALAAAGDFGPAIESGRKALELAPSEAAAMLQERIDDYGRGVFRGADVATAGKEKR